MNQAPQPPSPEQIAAEVDQQIQATGSEIAHLDSQIAAHEIAVQEADEQAAVADLRHKEIVAKAAALGVNAVVNTQDALMSRARKYKGTEAQLYSVGGSEDDRQRAGFAENVGTRRPRANGHLFEDDGTALIRQGRRAIWTGGNPAEVRLTHIQHEGARARALGMSQSNRYPWRKVTAAAVSLRGLLTQGPKRFRRADPHAKQLETDHDSREQDRRQGDGIIRGLYRSGTEKVDRRAGWGQGTAEGHGTATVSDAFALAADRIRQEVRHSIKGTDLPARIAHRDSKSWPGLLRDGDRRFINIPAIGAEELSNRDAMAALERRHQEEGGSHLSHEVVARELRTRLANQDKGLADYGKNLYQLAFGASDTERPALNKELVANQNRIMALRDTSRPAGTTANERAQEQGLDLAPFADSLLAANRHTLADIANIRERQEEIAAGLQRDTLDPYTRSNLEQEREQLGQEYRALNGEALTDAQEDIAERNLRPGALVQELALEREQLADAQPRLTTAQSALDTANKRADQARDNLDSLRSRGANTDAIQAAAAELETAEEAVTNAVEKRDQAKKLVDIAADNIDSLTEDILMLQSVSQVLSRRREIFDLDARNHEIDVILDGGLPEYSPERRAVLDEFASVAQRQLDIAARKAALDAEHPTSQDVDGQRAADLQRQFEQGMLLLAPPDGRRDAGALREFLGPELSARLEEIQSTPGLRNGQLAAAIKTLIRGRLKTIQDAEQAVRDTIRSRAHALDTIMPEERIVLPAVIRAVSARPKVLRRQVGAAEQAYSEWREHAVTESSEAIRKREQREDLRYRLAALEHQKAAIEAQRPS